MLPRFLLVRRRPATSKSTRPRLKVDLRPAQRQDRFLTPAGVKADENEQRQVEPRLRSARRADQASGLLSGSAIDREAPGVQAVRLRRAA